MGSRIYASDTPAAVPSAVRPTTRDEVHRGTTVKIASPTSPLDKSLQSTGWSIQPVLLVQPALMQDSCLHDQGEMFALIAEQRKVFQRIAVDQDDVGEGTCLQCTHLPGMRSTSAPIVVAERMISMGETTSWRMVNSLDWSQCSSPSRSLPSATGMLWRLQISSDF